MSAFRDAGHHWWQQCPACGMAWFIGGRPSDPDAEEECARCRAGESLSSARDAALEEAADQIECGCGLEECRQNLGPERIRALMSEPARRFVDVEHLRSCLMKYIGLDGAEHIMRDLGVDLDGAGGVFFVPTQDNGVTSLVHHVPEYATVENGLLPAPRRPVTDCGHVNPGDGLCAHPGNTTPECHEAACPMLPAPRKGERDE
jgi:hypothetical protein